MQYVFVVDRNKQPLMPCHPARARKLLALGRAAVYRRFPFTIILLDQEGGKVQTVQFKIDPGSKQTGLALVAEGKRGKRVVWAAMLEHRGQAIKAALADRRTQRRSRRHRHTRYRKARFENRRRPEGCLPPSLQSRVENIWTWVCRIHRLCPLASISQELVKFDTQLLQNAEMSGVEYQQGELAGYEIRAYLLEKWGRRCVYCGAKETPLEIEHITPSSRGGSNRVSNLTLACHVCNQRKANQTAAEFGYLDIQRRAKHPLQDAAAVNATRWALWRRLEQTGLEIEAGTGGRTQFNRMQQCYPKAHWIDAACVGESGKQVFLNPDQDVLRIKAVGRQSRQMCQMDKYGFPRTGSKQGRIQFGFQTGDIVRAVVTAGVKTGRYVGRVAIRSSGNFNITNASKKVQGIHYRYITHLHKADGYAYKQGKAAFRSQRADKGFSH
jgi:5-methylcytosine-specific restriction endonuclease McrA